MKWGVGKTMNNADKKACPLRFNEDYTSRFKCIGDGCSWWCNFANDCSVSLLAKMFAGASICRNYFESYDSYDDIGIF